MKTYEATEQAYKNGYEQGYADGKKSAMESFMFPRFLARSPEISEKELEALLKSPVIIHKRREEIIPLYHNWWIPVTERLPQEDERVLVWVGENDCYFPSIDTDRLHKGRWVRWDGYITHWMPLPQPPKGE